MFSGSSMTCCKNVSDFCCALCRARPALLPNDEFISRLLNGDSLFCFIARSFYTLFTASLLCSEVVRSGAQSSFVQSSVVSTLSTGFSDPFLSHFAYTIIISVQCFAVGFLWQVQIKSVFCLKSVSLAGSSVAHFPGCIKFLLGLMTNSTLDMV